MLNKQSEVQKSLAEVLEMQGEKSKKQSQSFLVSFFPTELVDFLTATQTLPHSKSNSNSAMTLLGCLTLQSFKL